MRVQVRCSVAFIFYADMYKCIIIIIEITFCILSTIFNQPLSNMVLGLQLNND